jgi:histidyl-tRNA synthetase
MALSTQPYKGTRDFFPKDYRIQEWMFDQMRQAARSFGYEAYDGPMLESFDLYAAKTGEEIVNQQLYWLMDRGERKMAVRPEMTPTMARMVAAKFHELPKPVRWFSIPNLWRYERPQKGRLREHWQWNVDLLGGDSIMADAEVIGVAMRLMKQVKGEKFIKIKINNRKLIDYLFQQKLKLNSEVALGVVKAIDAKDKIGLEAYTEWLNRLGLSQTFQDELSEFFKLSFAEVVSQYACQGTDELVRLFEILKEQGFESQVEFDPTVMRGMNYYTGTVFEIYDASPENRRAMFGGGRYDNLIGLFGKDKISGVGFGMGDVTFRDFLETHQLMPELKTGLDFYIAFSDVQYRGEAQQLATELRNRGYSVAGALELLNFGGHLKTASKLGAMAAVLFGEEEFKNRQVVVKRLLTGQQEVVALDQLKTTWVL